MKSQLLAWKNNLFFYFLLSTLLFGMGYTFFNNVSNYLDSTSDAAFYLFYIENGFSVDENDHRGSRILVPKLVSIIYGLCNGNVGSWDSLKFSFFIINSLFLILSVAAYHKILRIFGYSDSLIRVAAILFLSSFASANYFLRGSVDPGEILFLAALTLTLLLNKIQLTPLIFALGMLNRETFLATGTALFFADILYDYYWKKTPLTRLSPKLICLCLSMLAAAAAHIGVKFYITGGFSTPIDTFNKLDNLPEWQDGRSLLEETRRFLYVFLIPTACTFFSPVKLPSRIVLHIFVMSIVVLFGSWVVSTSGTGLSRYLYSASGFYLSLMVASCIFRTDSTIVLKEK